MTIRMPRAIFVESWVAAPRERAVRCGFEASALDELTPRGLTWIDEPDAVARVRSRGEDLCRSVRVTP